MNSVNDFKKRLHTINTSSEFNSIALQLFKYQSKNNQVYKKYIQLLGKNPNQVNDVKSIPFLPIEFFKNNKIKTGKWDHEAHFTSSGTGDSGRSTHLIRDIEFYKLNVLKSFNQFYGNPNQYHFFALLPSYLENEHSSLIFMIRHLIKVSNSRESGFYLDNYIDLINKIESINTTNKKIFLFGVSFALLDLIKISDINLQNGIIMETGGMKGRGKEIVREELHKRIKGGFNVAQVHSEYGMTELLSQAYSDKDGYFSTPKWMKILIRDIYDPFSINKADRPGGINVIDLANFDTCSFIETKDLGIVRQNGTFEILGRIDNSDLRGCNLLIS